MALTNPQSKNKQIKTPLRILFAPLIQHGPWKVVQGFVMSCKWSQARDFYVSFITPRLRRRKNIYYSPCQTEIKAGYVMSGTHNSPSVIITLLDHSMPIRLVCKQCWVRWWWEYKYKIKLNLNQIWIRFNYKNNFPMPLLFPSRVL